MRRAAPTGLRPPAPRRSSCATHCGCRLPQLPVSQVAPPVDFHIGDVIRLRKPHPCKGFDWTVVRIGADIGLHCTTCGRRVLLSRSVVERRLKSFVARPDFHEPFDGADALRGLEPLAPPGAE
ncbi:MAG: DUF951 domain-containing protein [Chloroflexi bacterium]|nr:DUF951 domain-containing protein [Chloroflexota bacterium]